MANGWRIIWLRGLAMATVCPLSLAAALAAEEPSALGPSTDCGPAIVRRYPRNDEHVRSAQPKVVALISDGLSRSQTFRDLMTMLDSSDVVAYVELASKMPTGLEGYVPHWLLTSGGLRYARIFVDYELAHDRLIQVIAHELQHAVELAKAPDVRSNDDMRKLFQRLDSGACRTGCTETDAALDVQQAVGRELRGQRRVRDSTLVLDTSCATQLTAVH